MSGVRFVHVHVHRFPRIFVAIPAAARAVLQRLRKPPALTSTL